MKTKWTKEMCHEEALKYSTRRIFKKESGAAYYAAEKHNWLNEICLHIKETVKPHNYWTKEMCHEEALKYLTRNEFSIGSNSAYKKSLENNWIDELCSHMKILGNRMFRCIYVYEFSDNYAYVGLTHDVEERNSSRKGKNLDAVTKHINEANITPVLKKLTDYVDVSVASKLENIYIEEYRNSGWNILNRARGGVIGGSYLLWTYEKCKNEALKYATKSDFKKGSDSAYKSSKKHGWFDEICQHMVSKIHHWTVNEVKIEALKYSNRFDFYKHSMAAYTWASRKKILNDVCSHM